MSTHDDMFASNAPVDIGASYAARDAVHTCGQECIVGCPETANVPRRDVEAVAVDHECSPECLASRHIRRFGAPSFDRAMNEALAAVTLRARLEDAVPKEMVDHPQHYQSDANLEVIDVLDAFGLAIPFCVASIIKYTLRYNKKDGLQDLEKSAWYNAWLVNRLKAGEPRFDKPTRKHKDNVYAKRESDHED